MHFVLRSAGGQPLADSLTMDTGALSVNIGNGTEREMLADLGHVCREAGEWGIPVLAMEPLGALGARCVHEDDGVGEVPPERRQAASVDRVGRAGHHVVDPRRGKILVQAVDLALKFPRFVFPDTDGVLEGCDIFFKLIFRRWKV
jgi:hypothetical protein